MVRFLVLRLYGPLCSWGGPAVGELRPSEDHPTRSALLGLIGACLGLRRDDAEAQEALARGYSVAVRVDAPGRRREDYHTVQAPKARKGFNPATRRQELAGSARDLETMVTRRGYLEDAAFTVAFAARDGAAWSLDVVAEALRRPRFQPYLGRKSCPPSLPLAPVLSDAADLPAALADADAVWTGFDFLAPLTGRLSAPCRVLWDDDMAVGALRAHSRSLRRDEPGDRGRWQFTERTECEGRIGEGA